MSDGDAPDRAEGFRPTTTSWIEDPGEARDRLSRDPLTPLGHIADASNHAVLCQLGPAADGVYAVYKPAVGERPLWDFPAGSLHRREVATHLVSDLLGWDLVPPTVLRDGPDGPGSLQLFVPHDPAEHYFELVDDERWHAQLARLALFDLATNNADRKGGHILRHTGRDRLHAIDNGLTFHAEPKLRTVVWDVGHIDLDGAWTADVGRFAGALEPGGDAEAVLANLLEPLEITALAARCRWVAGLRRLPTPPPDARPYPWPMV